MKQATATDDTGTIKHVTSKLDTNETIQKLIGHVRNMEHFKTDHDADAGTLVIYCKGWKVFQGIQKGGKRQPWIVRFNRKLFTA